MEKTTFQKLFRDYMKKQGFRTKGNISYKYLDDDYLVVVDLDHSPYRKAYCVAYGVVYEADQANTSVSSKTDWRRFFYFTSDPADNLEKYSLDDTQSGFGRELTTWFDYSERSADDFVCSMDINMQKQFMRLYDKEFVLEQYRNNWVSFRRIPYDTVYKICRLSHLDAEQVIKFRDRR